MQKHQTVRMLVCRKVNELLCVYERGDLIGALSTQLWVSCFPPMTKQSVSKGRDRSSVIDTTHCSVKAIDFYTRTHSDKRRKGSACSPEWMQPSLSTSGLWLCAGMCRHEKRTVSCSFCISVDELMRGESERERESHEPVPSAFFSPMNLPTRCLPPTSSQQWWNFSFSSLARFLTLCFSFSLLFTRLLPVSIRHTSSRNVCLPFPRSLHLSFVNFTIFLLISLHQTLAVLSFLTGSIFEKCVCVCVSPCASTTAKHWRLSAQFKACSTVIVMFSKSRHGLIL